MAKVINPYDTFKNTKRLSKRILLKNRREGNTVTFQALTKKMVFFKETHDDTIKTKLQERWKALSPTEKQKWEQLGETVLMEGETFYKQQEKKSMTQGFYKPATYGATRFFAVIATKYSYLYGEGFYGVAKYRFK